MININVIYKITCLTNDKIYIGRSQEVEKRWRSHINQLKNNKHSNYFLQQDFNSYGLNNFNFEILNEFESSEKCKNKEMEIINSYESDLIYNIVKDSSVGGNVFTNNPRKEELRIMKIKQMSGSSNHQYGKPKSEKMINSVKEANSKKVKIENNIFKSLTEASKFYKIGVSTVAYRLKSSNFKDWNYI